MVGMACRILIPLASLVLATTAGGSECHRYTVQIVQKGCSFGNAANAWGLGDADQVCGWYSCGASTLNRPFIWQNAVLTNIPLLPGLTEGRAFDVNITGQAVGRMGTGGGI